MFYEEKEQRTVWEKRVSSVGIQDGPTPDGSVAMRLRYYTDLHHYKLLRLWYS
jgi:hypothetical protein